MKKNQPKLKVHYKPLWRSIDILSITFIIASIVYLILNYSDLPNQIPIHFNIKGEVDSFGSKSTIWIIPFMSIFQYALLTIISRYPHTFNYAVKITEQNATNQYNIAIDMMSQLKLCIVIFFSFTLYQIVQIAKAGQGGLGKASTILLLVFITLIIIRSIIQSKSRL